MGDDRETKQQTGAAKQPLEVGDDLVWHSTSGIDNRRNLFTTGRLKNVIDRRAASRVLCLCDIQNSGKAVAQSGLTTWDLRELLK